MLKQIFKNVISLSSFLYCRSCRCWVSQRLHSQAVCVLAIFIILCHDSLFQDGGKKQSVLAHAGSLARESTRDTYFQAACCKYP